MSDAINLSVYGTGGNPIKDPGYSLKKNTTLVSLLEELNSKNMLPKRFKPTEDFQDILVIVNHENILPLSWLDYSLKNVDSVLILSALAGG